MPVGQEKEKAWGKLDEIFELALDLAVEERVKYLDQACADDADLRRMVERLIEADQRAQGFLEEPVAKVSWAEVLAAAPAGAPAPTLVERPKSTENAHPFPAGKMLAERYRIVRLLGQGGMGAVYQAEDLTLGQTIALKFLSPGHQRDPLRLELFLNEVRLARQIAHPHVCRVYDVVEADGQRFLSMEYVDGEDLAALMRRIGRLSRERALVLAQELCRGLEAAHRQGILHRDLKPANLMIDSAGHLRIADFGLAWLHGPAAATTEDSPLSKVRAGTPSFMAPEQLQGHKATVASDLYALGLVLYELFTGHRAFAAENALKGPKRPIPPSDLVEDLPPEIEREILRCLEVHPERRPASAGEVAATLAQKAAAPWRPAPGQVIPHRSSWRLERQLGAGGFGQAWLAIHKETRDHRVFKFCHEAAHLEALKREITLFRLLKEELGDRDDITRILDWSFDEPPWFIESEFTEGGDFAEWTRQQGGLTVIPLEERLDIVAQVATALAAAHSIGILHKDVKPSNILLRRDGKGHPHAQLADFGIGTVLERERLDRAGITVLGFTGDAGTMLSSQGGTHLYMAPELLEGKPATLQADLYALGVVLYQVVVGDLSRALAVGWQDDVEDELLAEDIAAAVDGRPDHRLGDAQALAERLRRLPERREARQERQRLRREAVQSRRRRRQGIAAVALALVLVVLVLFHAGQIEQEASRTRNAARSSIAGEWLSKDPTRAALVLLEVDDPAGTSFVDSRMRQALGQDLALLELRGHADVLRSAAWSPDGRTLFTASYDSTVRLWDADSGRLQAILRGHDNSIYDAAWSPDGLRLATASDDGTARLWDLAAPTESLVLRDHETSVLSVAWSPDGSSVVTTSKDNTARVWNAQGQGLASFIGHTAMVWMAAWSPDGLSIATTSHDHTARIWRLDTPTSIVLRGHSDWIWTAAWNPNGTHVVTASNDQTARIWSASGGETQTPHVLRGHQGRVWMAAWSPDGKNIATASDDGAMRVWALHFEETPDGEAHLAISSKLIFIGEHEGGVKTVSWHMDGQRLLTTSKDLTARIWRLGLSAERQSIVLRGHEGHVESGAWSPNGERVVTASSDMTARVWRPGSAEAETAVVNPARNQDIPDTVTVAAWSPNGRRILLVSNDHAKQDAPSPKDYPSQESVEIDLLADPDGDIRLATWSPDGQRLLLGLNSGTALVRTAAGRVLLILEGHEGPVRAVAWSPDGGRVLTASDTTAYINPITSDPPPDLLRRPVMADALAFTGHHQIRAAAWSPDQERIATVSFSGRARIWSTDPATPPEAKIVNTIDTHPMLSVAWSPDGTFLLTGLTDGSILAWDLRQDAANSAPSPIRLKGHAPKVSQIVFNPRGDQLATMAEEGRVLVWSLEEIHRYADLPSAAARNISPRTALMGHSALVLAVAWSADGRYLSTASRDGRVRAWRLGVEDLRAALSAATQMCLDPEFRQDVLGENRDAARRRHENCELSRGREP